jgi:outer membrane murein-binding lipoprotein Lpp
MKQVTLKWSAVAVLAAVAVYLGTLVGTAQPEVKPDPNAAKLDQTLQKLDELSKKMDDLSQKIDALGKDVAFIKARGKG